MPEQRKTLNELVLDGTPIESHMVFAERGPSRDYEGQKAREYYTIKVLVKSENQMARVLYGRSKWLDKLDITAIDPAHSNDIYIPELSVHDAKAIMAARFKKKEEEERKRKRKRERDTRRFRREVRNLQNFA